MNPGHHECVAPIRRKFFQLELDFVLPESPGSSNSLLLLVFFVSPEQMTVNDAGGGEAEESRSPQG